MTEAAPKKKHYHKTTKSPAIKVFEAEYARTNNASLAVKKAFPGQLTDGSARVKATRLLANDNVARGIEEQRKAIERHADAAIQSLASLSTGARSEMVRHSSSAYLVDQAHGKATQKVETTNRTVTVSMDLTKELSDNQGKE